MLGLKSQDTEFWGLGCLECLGTSCMKLTVNSIHTFLIMVFVHGTQDVRPESHKTSAVQKLTVKFYFTLS